MAAEGTKRICIAVVVTSDGDWVAYGISRRPGMTEDETDELNKHVAVQQLRGNAVGERHYRINMVEADVILPILENKEVVVQANGPVVG